MANNGAGAWLRQQKRYAGPWLHLAIILGWLNALILAGTAWLLADIVNAVSFEQQSLDRQWPQLGWLLLLVILRGGIFWASEYSASLAAERVKQGLRRDLLTHIRHLGPGWLPGQLKGSLGNTLGEGVDALEGYYTRFLPAMIYIGAVPLTLLIFIAPRDWLSALILITTAPLVPFFMILIGKGAEKRNQRQWRQMARMSAYFLDLVQGLTTLKLFNAGKREERRIEHISENYRQRTMSVLRIAFLSSFTLEFFATVSIAVVAVIIGFRLYWGQLEFVHGFFILLLAPEFYLPLRNLGSSYHDRMQALGAADGIMELLDTPLPAGSRGTHRFQPENEHGIEIDIRKLSFSYPDRERALHEIDLQIRAGERIALVGTSGAGKSTLINLLLGFISADEGQIRVDAQPLVELEPSSWHEQIAWVPQQPHLFTATLLDNIRLGMRDAPRQAVIEAARKAHCLEFVDGLPEGFDTLIGEGGRRLSGGQQQRVALARAFLRNAHLALLDEPTASLDIRSEQLVSRAIDSLAESCTLISIAHRLHTVEQADRILVLDKGRIVQQGRHTELSRQPGVYRDMLEAGSRLAQ